MTAGDPSPILTRPLPLAFTIIAIGLLVWPLWRERRARRVAARTHTSVE
jgi:TctA family transporter